MKYTFNASISYTIDSRHPDYTAACKGKRFLYSDVYRMDSDYFWSKDDMINYIRKDLAPVAGGGYDTKHIHNVKYTIIEEDE